MTHSYGDDLDSDPLAARLATVDVGHPSEHLRAIVNISRPLVRRRRRERRVYAGVAVIAFLLALMVVTPVGATLGRAILPEGLQQRLGLVVGAPPQLSPGGRAAPTFGGPTSGQIPPETSVIRGGGGQMLTPSLSLAEAQGLVAFPVPIPRNLPLGLVFSGALVDSIHSIYLHYADLANQRSVSLQVRQGSVTGGSAVPAGSVRQTNVGGGPAYYVHGSYEDAGPGTAATWNPNADVVELTWQGGGMTYDLTAAGLHFSMSDAVQLAQSVR